MKKSSKNLPFLFSVIFISTSFFSFLANAQVQQIIDQQDWITRNQQNKIEEERRDKEQETIRKERARKKKERGEEQEETKNQSSKISGKLAQCFSIKEVRLNGANSISKSRQQKLTSAFLGKCFEGSVLSELISVIQTYYNDQGYVTARAAVPKQNIQSGILELNILEGKINEVIIGDNNFTDKMQEFTAFGFLEGDTLNIADINQGIYQINRLPSNSATMKIEPAIAEGEAKVYVVNDKKFPARATIGYDNLGNDFTGIYRTNFSGGLDNLLFLNDAVNLSYSTNLNDRDQTKDIKSFTSSFSIPLGYNTFSYDYSHSEFRGTNSGISGPISLTGFSQRSNVTIDRVLLSKGNLRISTNASLAAKSSASYLNQQKIETSERKLTIGTVAFSISNYFQNGVNIYLKPSYSKGLKILNAKQDQVNSSAATPKAQFDVFKFYASISKRLQIPKLNTPVTLTTEMDSQYAKQTLFGSEQFSVGGYYSVRGFRENYIAGDIGYNFRNKASFNLGSILTPLFAPKNNEKTSETFFTKNLNHLNKFRLEPFYDYGYAQNKYNNSSGRMSGAGIKTIFDSKYFNASVTYSQALQKSRLITSPVKENKMVYFEMSATCC